MKSLKYFLSIVARLATSVALFLVIRAFVVEMFKIPTPSMQRTLLVGDFLVVDKMVYGAEIPFIHIRLPAIRHPRSGDVIVFKWPSDPSINFVKRIVAVPGDTILMRNGQLIRDGLVLNEPYVSHSSPDTDPSGDAFTWQRDYLISSLHATQSYWPSRNNWGPLIVPTKSYFVLGDNRDNSLDSRYWGFVPDSLVRGRPLIVYFSYEPDSASRISWLRHIRWKRLGTIVR
jgi:signal peptidase I